jgi:hypothetical protein
MTRDREWWLAELNFALSCFAALMAVLLVFCSAEGVAQAIRDQSNPDRIGAAFAVSLGTPLARAELFAPFMLGSFVGFRFLVPTFAGAPPRVVAAIVVTWPLVFAGFFEYGDPLIGLWFGAIGLAWGLTMPLPSKNLFVYGPVVGGAIVGLAFGALAQPSLGLEVAILWCALRLYQRHMDEVAATAIAAALVPGLLALHDLPAARFTGNSVYLTTEIAILLALATAALVFSSFATEPTDTAADE